MSILGVSKAGKNLMTRTTSPMISQQTSPVPTCHCVRILDTKRDSKEQTHHFIHYYQHQHQHHPRARSLTSPPTPLLQPTNHPQTFEPHQKMNKEAKGNNSKLRSLKIRKAKQKHKYDEISYPSSVQYIPHLHCFQIYFQHTHQSEI